MRLTVLVVEGALSSRLDAHAALGSAGCTVVTAASVAEGKLLAGTRRFDVVVLDALLMEGTGKHLVEQLRAQHTPLVITCPHHSPAALMASFTPNAHPMLRRPFTSAQLVETVEGAARTGPPSTPVATTEKTSSGAVLPAEKVRPTLVRSTVMAHVTLPAEPTLEPSPAANLRRHAPVGQLFDAVVAASGLSSLLARGTLERLCVRNNVPPARLTAADLRAMLPELASTLRLFLKNGAEERVQALEALASPSPLNAGSALRTSSTTASTRQPAGLAARR